MARRIVIRREAELDIESGYLWYEDQRDGLGTEFLDEVEACLTRVAADPKIYARVEGLIRRALLRRFPFGVFFIDAETAINVIAVFHTSRDIRALQRRLA